MNVLRLKEKNITMLTFRKDAVPQVSPNGGF